MDHNNILKNLPGDLSNEVIELLVSSENIRIERIVSKGHITPENDWCDQDENEWVLVIKGAGKVLFENGDETLLEEGGYINIPAHCRHRVSWTDPNTETIWLAIFYK